MPLLLAGAPKTSSAPPSGPPAAPPSVASASLMCSARYSVRVAIAICCASGRNAARLFRCVSTDTERCTFTYELWAEATTKEWVHSTLDAALRNARVACRGAHLEHHRLAQVQVEGAGLREARRPLARGLPGVRLRPARLGPHADRHAGEPAAARYRRIGRPGAGGRPVFCCGRLSHRAGSARGGREKQKRAHRTTHPFVSLPWTLFPLG